MKYITKYGIPYLEEIGERFNLFKIYRPLTDKKRDLMTMLKLDIILKLVEKGESDEDIKKILDIVTKTKEKFDEIKPELINIQGTDSIVENAKRIRSLVCQMKKELKETGIFD